LAASQGRGPQPLPLTVTGWFFHSSDIIVRALNGRQAAMGDCT